MHSKVKVIHDTDSPARELFAGGRVKLIHSENMTLAHWQFKPGTDLPEHSHPHEQITKIIDGEFEFTVDGVKHLLKAGSAIIIPPDAVHSGKSLSDVHLIDAFYPVREDLKEYK